MACEKRVVFRFTWQRHQTIQFAVLELPQAPGRQGPEVLQVLMECLPMPPGTGHDVPAYPAQRTFGRQHPRVSDENPKLEGIHDPGVVATPLDDSPHFGIDLPRSSCLLSCLVVRGLAE